MLNQVKEQIEESLKVKQDVLEDSKIVLQIQTLVNKSLEALAAGGKIIFCGNGGSFADAQHLTAEFVSRLRFDRSPLASFALGTNNSCISAIGNDYGYDHVFARELAAIGSAKDIFIPISTSGKSQNVLKAIEVAKELQIFTLGLTGGTGGEMVSECECIVVPSSRTERIQEIHIMVGHIICGLVEELYFKYQK